MNCPYCEAQNSRVIDSRDVNDGIRRRRQCLGCESRFTTYERIQPSGLFVIKKDQRREEFNKEKLMAGIHKACEKRPLPIGAVDKLGDDIEAELFASGRAEISGTVIGDMVMERLKNLDFIAYIRFASVYRDFMDITSLKREIDSLVDDEAEYPSPTSQLPLMADEDIKGATRGRQRSRK